LNPISNILLKYLAYGQVFVYIITIFPETTLTLILPSTKSTAWIVFQTVDA